MTHYRIVRRIARNFSLLVCFVRATDIEVWTYAKQEGFAILSKDGDFRQLSFLHGAPPKVIWLRAGNASVDEINRKLDATLADIMAFLGMPTSAPVTID